MHVDIGVGVVLIELELCGANESSIAGSGIMLWAIRSQKAPSSLLCCILVRRAWRHQDEQESQPGWRLQGLRQVQLECTLCQTGDCLYKLSFHEEV